MWCEEGHLQDIFKNSEYFEKYNYKYSSIRIIYFFTWATAHLSLVHGSALVHKRRTIPRIELILAYPCKKERF
jgi:hypothetical protein